MSIIDAIKKSVLEGFNSSLSGTDIVFGLGVAFLASLFVLFIDRSTMKQVTLNRSFCVSLLLLGTVSAMMVLTITSNLALSLGMVGALSIIRFRTAVKDASDTAFLFWAVAAGITSGAGFYLLTLLGCLVVGFVCVAAMILFDRVDRPFLLVIRAEGAEVVEQAEAILQRGKLKYQLSSQVHNKMYTEVIYEIGIPNKNLKLVSRMQEIPGVTNVSLVDCRKG